jgi:hypothetical protein
MAVGGGTITTLTTTSDITVQGVTVGRGAGAVATNTALGASALASNSTGVSTTAIGYQALTSNTQGYNTAVGYRAGYANTSGFVEAFGYQALNSNTTGGPNQAFGGGALFANTTGSNNVAVGSSALTSNTTASNNTAVGYTAGYSLVTSVDNTLFGSQAGYSTTSAGNTFVGQGSGYYVSSGAKNTIIGRYTGNQGGLNILTSNNAIVLSDGDGNPKYYSQNGVNTDYNYSNVSLTAGVAYNLVPIKSIYPYLGAVNAAIMTVVVTGSNSSDGGYAGYFILSLTQAFGTYTVTVINSGLPHNNSGYSFTFGLTSSFLTVTAGKTTSMSYSAIVVTGSYT